MTQDTPPPTEAPRNSPPNKRLVLCFDGTRNKFTADETDTNIVQIYKLLDRTNERQFHYYQPGIGSYVPGHMSNPPKSHIFTRIKNGILERWDEAFGISFVDHVIAGYKFLMRYYSPGDKIYMFGFSRGAYTARYLTEMIYTVGLLSQGNEEMIPFVWDTFSDYQTSRAPKDGAKAKEDAEAFQFIQDLKDTFCRDHLSVHFLGLFDCVNSVAHFGNAFSRASAPYKNGPPAQHIRHAVSIHERRVAFKPTLFAFDDEKMANVDVKDVYFAGNHGDVGGGWKYAPEVKEPMPEDGSKPNVLPVLLSDIALNWMISEVQGLDNAEEQDANKNLRNILTWRGEVELVKAEYDRFNTLLQVASDVKKVLNANPKTNLAKITGGVGDPKAMRTMFHDPLRVGQNNSRLMTFMWWILEILPFISYFGPEKKDSWVERPWRPNWGRARRIPLKVRDEEPPELSPTSDENPVYRPESYFHSSVKMLKEAGVILPGEISRPRDIPAPWSPFSLFRSRNGQIKLSQD